jgi:hypothetical protein
MSPPPRFCRWCASPSQRSGIVSHLVVLPVVLPIPFLWGDAVSPANIAGVGISGRLEDGQFHEPGHGTPMWEKRCIVSGEPLEALKIPQLWERLHPGRAS